MMNKSGLSSESSERNMNKYLEIVLAFYYSSGFYGR